MTYSAPHSRSQSLDDDEGAAPKGSAYQLILDHVLTYPATFEIPLRTMYALNCAPQTRQAKSHHSASSTSSAASSRHSPSSSQTASFQDKQVTQTFTDNLMAQIAQCSHQPTSLPPSFILAFLRRCFPPQLIRVDFPQALTGLDYLKDLEARRRREVSSAVARLGIDRRSVETRSNALHEFPALVPWLRRVEEQERKIESLYTQLYVGLRRWILINELSLLPFHKSNCVAMLNTLFPPLQAKTPPPTSKLTRAVLTAQREGFFKYINIVEKYGAGVLENLQNQGAAPGDDNGWVAITRCLHQYLQLTMGIIYEYSEIVDVADLEPKRTVEPVQTEKPTRKVDSGISFTTNIEAGRPSSQGSAKSPTSPSAPNWSKNMPSIKGGTTLEKLARGLRTIGRGRVDATEIIDTMTSRPQTPTEKPRGLRKMRSLGALDRSGKNVVKADAPAFDADEMRRQRHRYEAVALAQQKFGHRQNHEA